MKQKLIRAVVVEDEDRNRHYITSLISTMNKEFEVVGSASSVEEGYELIVNSKPDIVFVDIKMPDGTAFDLLAKFKKEPNLFEVIFVTGFDEYAIKAFEFNAIDYVLKPIDEEKFASTLIRAEKRILSANMSGNGDAFNYGINNKGIITKIPVHYKDKVHLLSVEDIESVQTMDGCTVFTLYTREKFTSSKHMADFEFIFSEFAFFERISRSVFVNLNFVANYSKGLACTITTKTGEKFEVSRRKKAQVISAISRDKSMNK